MGIDALRIQRYTGDFAAIDGGLIIGEKAKKENSAVFFRFQDSINGNDLESVTILLDNGYLIGGGIERAIVDFGFWFETAFMHFKAPATTDANEITKYWRTSIGSDYALTPNLIMMLEYHYNGAGSNQPHQYQQQLQQVAYQQGGVFLLGKHYVIPALSWSAMPLVTFNASAFYNMSDQSVFINLASEISWSDNLYSDLGAYLSDGEHLYFNDNKSLLPRSEFGSYPLSVFTSIRYYF